MTRHTSIRLPDDLADRVTASDLSLPAIIARGLDCTGHAGNPMEDIRARLMALEERTAAHEATHPAPCRHQQAARRKTQQWEVWAADIAGIADPFTPEQAGAAWPGLQRRSISNRLTCLTTAGYIRELPPLPPELPGRIRMPRRWEHVHATR